MKTRIIYFVFILSLVCGCKDDPLSLFEGKDAIAFTYLSGKEQDSISYSFKFNPIAKEKDTVWLNMQLIGKLSDKSRKIALTAGEGTTAVEGLHYNLPPYELPPNQYQVKYPIVLFNTKDIATKEVRLVLQVSNSEDLTIGTKGSTGVSTSNTPMFKINFSGDLIKPDYWGYIEGYIGQYSKARYQFMIGEFGSADFRPDTKGGIITYPQWLNIKVRLRNALDAYVKLHGDLIDENGAKVEFPI